MTITTAQIRAARGLLNWSQSELAEQTSISATSIGSIENGNTQPREQTLSTIQRIFELAGIEFVADNGVRLRTPDIRTYTGHAGFIDFYDDMYQTLKSNPQEVLVSNVDASDFEQWLGDFKESHLNRVQNIEGIACRILVRDSTGLIHDRPYITCRQMPEGFLASVPFYIYGSKTAILLFRSEPRVILLNYPEISTTYRIQFEDVWQRAIEQNKK